MSFYREHLIKKPQKEYRCFGCDKKMRKDRAHWYQAGIWEGEFFASRMCCACVKHMEKHPEDFEEGYCEGDIFTKRWQYVYDRERVRERKPLKERKSAV